MVNFLHLCFHFPFLVTGGHLVKNENNGTKTLTAEDSYMKLGFVEFRLIQKQILDGWNYR